MAEPKIRFKKNDGSDYPEWDEHKLGDVLTEDLYPVPNPEGAYTKLAIRSHGKGTFDKHIEAGDSLDVDKMFEVKADRVLLNITFAWELAIAITSERDEGKLVSHRFPQYKIDGIPQFFKYYLINERMRYDLSVASPGGAGRNRVLNKKDFLEIRKNIPCLEEQQKIASFFSDIDEVISQSEVEVAALEKQKKGAMQKIFSQEVRFKMDDGNDYPDWENKRLENVCSFCVDGNWIESKDQSDSGVRLIQTGNIGLNKFIDKADKKKWISEDTFERLKCTEVVSGDILISRLPSPAGRACIVPNTNEKMITAVDCTIVRTNENTIKEYLVQCLSNYDYFKQIETFLAGGTRQRISRSNLQNIIVPIPCLEEQQKIADFLSDFDTAIDLAKQELEKWKLLKKGLMQQMFV